MVLCAADKVKIRRLHHVSEIAPLRAQINALNLASARPDPFSTYEHIENLMVRGDCFRRDPPAQAWFIAAFAGDELVGFVALKRTPEKLLGMPVRRIDFLVGGDGDRPCVIAKPEHLAAVTKAVYAFLVERRRDWDYVELQHQDAASPLYPLPRGVRLNGCLIREYPTWDNCTIQIRWSTIQEYIDALAAKFRANVKRQMRKLYAGGALELLSSSDPDATPALLELYCSVERRSWKTGLTTAVDGDRAHLEYYEKLLAPQQPMKISILVLLLDGAPIAGFILGSFETSGRKGLYGLHLAYDRRFHAVAPGSAMLMLAVHRAITERYAFLNLLAGFGYYKGRWLADLSPLRSAQLYRAGSLPYWRRLLGDLRRHLSVRQSEPEQRFNPLKRSAETDEPASNPADKAPQTALTAENRLEFARLVALARRGRHELLSPHDLVRILPFLAKGAG